MKFICCLLLAALAAIAQQAPAPAPAAGSKDAIVLTVGSQKFTQEQFEQILATLPAQQRANTANPAGRRQVAMQLAELLTLAQAAREKKLDQDAEMKWKIALSADQVLAGAMFQSLAAASADDAALRAYYDEHKSDFEMAKARHILIRVQGSRAPLRTGQKDLTDDEALAKVKDIRAKIVAGAKFDDLARTESDDTGTAPQGGDLGEFGHGAMVKDFDDAAFSQKIGELGQPVKTQFGYHLILVESRSTKPLDAVKDQISSKLGPAQAQKGLEELKKKTPAVLDDAYFGPPQPAPAPVPAPAK